METIEQLEQQLKVLAEKIEAVKKAKPQWEKGKWYKFIASKGLATSHWTDGLVVRFVKESGGAAEFDNSILGTSCSNKSEAFVPATPSEIEAALIAEAKRRYKIPCKVGYLDRCDNDNLNGYNLKYDHKKDSLFSSECMDALYSKGQWAEIISEPKIEIGVYAVESIEDGYKIGCKKVFKVELTRIQDFMHRNKFEFVNFSNSDIDYKVSLETINQILAKL